MSKDTDYKIGVEKRLTTIETTVKEIVENHLTHMNIKLNWILGLFVSALITLIFILASNLISKYI